jgi:hypothetical protein
LSFVSVRSLGDIAIGDMLIGNPNTEVPLANWGKKFRITPTSYGSRYQTILSSTTPFTWKSYRISASALSSSVLTTA